MGEQAAATVAADRYERGTRRRLDLGPQPAKHTIGEAALPRQQAACLAVRAELLLESAAAGVELASPACDRRGRDGGGRCGEHGRDQTSAGAGAPGDTVSTS